ncbi:FAD binding domain-containing protein [Nocardiopsis sp. Huas11]|uniref:FAD-dependent oxidoreductase n=1 Tax=Nocardiopsis sp. Huas11 TaxID=2183912 RepID=UPI000EB3F524|nr:FAD-dependent oxidoreductase [Nocardiopsis sp. Huas11]RKS07320.1 FAD binding domain-containing protein [Nocardiopsis sp. Huas11]
MDTTDVLVVGAGPTGLTLACSLRAQGVDVRVVDRAEGPATSSRANFLHARGSEVLDRLGALGDLPEDAISAMTITVHAAGVPVSVVRFGDTGLRTAAPALLLPQSRIERALRERLAELGGGVEWSTGLTGLEQDEEGVTATLDGGRTVRARWAVGCDGAHSTTRKLVGAAFPGAPVKDTWLLADVHMDWDLAPTGSYGWMHRDGILGALPMREEAGFGSGADPEDGLDPEDGSADGPASGSAGGSADGSADGSAGGPADGSADGSADGPASGSAGGSGDGLVWRLMAYAPGMDERSRDEDAVLAELRRLLPLRSGKPDAKVLDTVWTSVFRIHRRLVDDYRHGRVLLAGDAAHIHSPMGGQGMLTGIGDAENLAWKLVLVLDGRARTALLDTYRGERRPLAEDVLRVTTANSRLQLGEGPLVRFVREHVMLRLVDLPSVQRWATRLASQLGVSYRRGPLGARRRPLASRVPQPGDRVPDLPCLREDGSRTRLHPELGAHWVLLAADHDPATTDVVRALLGERVTTLTPTEEGLRDMLLIRPDAHLAWRGRPGDSPRAVLEGALHRGRSR